MAKKFPVDEFDSAPLHGGRHRQRRSAARGLLEFVQIAAATGVLAGAGFFAVNSLNAEPTLVNSDPSSSATTSTIVSRGGGVGISVLDASGAKGMASTVAHKLLDAGWNVFAAADLIDAFDKKATQKITVVYIQAEDLRSKAQALIGDLGTYEIVVSADYVDPITVVLGKDYQ